MTDQTDNKAPSDGRTVDAIRDLIFGQQMRDYDSRFADLEKSLKDRLEALSQSVDGEVKQLESTLEALRNEFATRLNDEVESLRDSHVSRASLADALRGLADQIDPR